MGTLTDSNLYMKKQIKWVSRSVRAQLTLTPTQMTSDALGMSAFMHLLCNKLVPGRSNQNHYILLINNLKQSVKI